MLDVPTGLHPALLGDGLLGSLCHFVAVDGASRRRREHLRAGVRLVHQSLPHAEGL